MENKKIWLEAIGLAKDQARHGKVHYSEIQQVAKDIYQDLLMLEHQDVFDVQIIKNIELEPVVESKHEKTKDAIKCAVCGKPFKVLTEKHIKTHGFADKKEYLAKFGLTKQDITIKGRKSGAKNPTLSVMHSIIKQYGLNRNGVKEFLVDKGFSGLKDLMDKAKESGKEPLDYLEQAAN